MANPIYILAAAREVEGKGSLRATEEALQRLNEAGMAIREFVVDPLSAGWNTPLAHGHFRSGCGPIEALAAACAAVLSGEAPVAVIRGEDLLRSEYAANKALRARRMAIYGEDCPLPEAYTHLARKLMTRYGVSEEAFVSLSDLLFENYSRTALRRGEQRPPSPGQDDKLTALFRKRDCANPAVDFRGCVVIGGSRALAELGLASADCVRVLATGTGRINGDGPASAAEIATYEHLRRAYDHACREADIDFTARFRAGEALLEVYTCFPPAPLAFLLTSGIARSPAELPEILKSHEVTVTGGMNLARAPWNNPALNAMVVMVEDLLSGRGALGLVHGNGGLGYRQGVALLGA